MAEIWKDIEGYEGLYMVGNLGHIMSIPHKYSPGYRIMKPIITPRGYFDISLCKKCEHKSFRIHRLVALAFIPNPENKSQINHKNGIKEDNRVLNLEWCTNEENRQHAIDIGLILEGRGYYKSDLKDHDIMLIRKLSKAGVTYKLLANQYGVSQSTIGNIVNKKIWKHL